MKNLTTVKLRTNLQNKGKRNENLKSLRMVRATSTKNNPQNSF